MDISALIDAAFSDLYSTFYAVIEVIMALIGGNYQILGILALVVGVIAGIRGYYRKY